MATALTSELTRFTDKCNNVLAGGIVKTFEPNSLTPKTTYQNPECTIPNFPEVNLDETGRAKIYIQGDYRIQVYSRDGILIEDNLLVEQTLVQRDFVELSQGIQEQLVNELQSFEVEKEEAIQDLLKHGGRAYPTLAAANADIANIALNTKVSVLSETEGGDYYKATAGATSLTKSPYDPLVQSKEYTDAQLLIKEGVRAITISGDTTLLSNQLDRRIIAFTGTLTADVFVTVPNVGGTWVIRNSTTGGFSLKVKGVSQGGNILIPSNKELLVEQNAGFIFSIGQPFSGGLLTDFLANTKATTDNSTSVATTAFVKSAIVDRESIRTISLTDSDQTILASSISTTNIAFTGVLTADRTITLSDTGYTHYFINSTTGGFALKFKGTGQSTTVTLKPSYRIFALLSGGFFQQAYAKPNADSFLEGAPEASSPTIEDNSTRLATTAHVKSLRADRQSVSTLAITGDTTLTTAQIVRDILSFTGSLSNDAVITFPNFSAPRIIRNLTNKNITVKGALQTGGIIVAPNGKAQILIVGDYVEIVLTSVNVDSSPMSYAGKHKWGDSYLAGQTFEHGSGLYQVVSDVSNLESPIGNSSVSKIAHNDLSGPNRSLAPITTTKKATTSDKSPRFITKDGRITLDATGRYIKASLDFGVTWDSGYLFEADLGNATDWVRQTSDGELLVCAYAPTAVTGTFTIRKLYKSTGYTGGLTSPPTWTLVKQSQYEGLNFQQWSFSEYKNYMFIGDYGAKTGVYYSPTLPAGAPAGQYARYLYMSKDYGLTWQTIFDLNNVTNGVGVHLHGACYDPYWNRIWVSYGDGAFGTNGIFYSDDFGKTWTSGTQFNNAGVNFSQSVWIVALPTCILFGSDSYPNGVQRIDRAAGRVPTKGYYNIESAWMVPDQLASLNHLCQSVAYTPWLPNSPVLFGFGAETQAGKSCVVATFNGWDFYPVWIDNVNSTSGFGVRSVTGITYENEVKILSNDPNRVDFPNWMEVTVKVDID